MSLAGVLRSAVFPECDVPPKSWILGKISQQVQLNAVFFSFLAAEILWHCVALTVTDWLFWCTGVSTGDTAVVIDWNTWHNSRQYFPSKPSFTQDTRYCLPVIGNLFTEVPLPHMPVQDIIAHVGFGPFHAFDIYVPLCHIKVVLKHWPCWWLFPKELISNLFPESWNKVIAVLRGCRQGR